MAVEAENLETKSEIGLKHIISFAKKYWKKMLFFAGASCGVTLVVIAFAYIFMPHETYYTSTINLQLAKVKGVTVYPSEKPFSAEDIISTAVLRQVYDINKVENKMKFDEFCALFSLTGQSVDRAKLAAMFRDKLNNKKNTVLEIKELEREYANELARLDDGKVSITMAKSGQFGSAESAKILNDVPACWFRIYHKLEAKSFPRIATVPQVASLHKNIRRDGKIVTLDKARIVCGNLFRACKELDEIVLGAKIALPSGEFLSDLSERLSMLQRHRIQPMLLVVMMLADYKHPIDNVSLRACIVDMEKKIKICTEKYEGTIAALNMLHSSESGAAHQTNRKDSSASVNMAIDGSFVGSLENLIRNASTIAMRSKLTEKAMEYKEELAELNAEREYYNSLINSNNASRGIGMTKDQLKAMEDNMFIELIDLSRKVNEFRDLIFNEYVQKRLFYTTGGVVEKYSDFRIPFARVMLGLLFVFVLVNAVNIGRLFYAAYNGGDLKD